jgi:uncharacterized protein involved in exopolysaccharide biosynthesis
MKHAPRQINYPVALWRRKWLILPLVALGLGGSFVAFKQVTPLYRAQATVVLIPQSISSEIYPKGWQIGDRLKFIEREIHSTTFLDALAEAQGLDVKDPDELRRLTRTVAVRKLDWETFVFSSVHPDRKIAAEKTNLVASIFVQQSQKRKIIESESSTKFLIEEIARLRGQIGVERGVMADYQAAHKGELPTDRDGHQRNQAFLRRKISELDARIETKEKDIADRQFLLANPGQPGLTEGRPTGAEDSRLAELAAAKKELSSANLRYTDRHPQVIRLTATVDAMTEEIRTNPYIPPLPGSGAARTAVVDPLNQDPLSDFVRLEILRLGGDITEMTNERAIIMDEIDRLEKLVQASYGRTNELARIAARIQLLDKKLWTDEDKLEILETEQEVFERGMDMRYALKIAAGVPVLPFHPDLLMFILFGAGGGGGLGVAIALLLEFMDRSVQTVDDLEELLDVELLAIIPNMDIEHRRSGPGRGSGSNRTRRREAAHG